MKQRCGAAHLYGFAVLPEHLAKEYPVGFYTTKMHYSILKMAGLTNILKNPRFYEEMSEDDGHPSTWYSQGLKLIDHAVTEHQSHLFGFEDFTISSMRTTSADG